MIRTDFTGLDKEPPRDVCVVGAGPVGICLALELDRLGMSVLLLESGGRKADRTVQELGAATIADPAAHDPMEISTARRLGGTSNLWGGRCLPYDPIDFAARPVVGNVRWPIDRGAIEPYLEQACRMAGAGAAVFEALPLAGTEDGDFSLDHLERWSNAPRLQLPHGAQLSASKQIDVVLGAVVTGLVLEDNGAVSRAAVASPDGSRRIDIPVRVVVLAAGGVETTRLLLAAQAGSATRFGGKDGPLGRYYMGHVVGSIADIALSSASLDDAMDFTVDPEGFYVRRRFVPKAEAQIRHGIMNSALWPVVPNVWEAAHGSGILSAIYLALSSKTVGSRLIPEALRRRHVPAVPEPKRAHIENVVRDFPAATAYISKFIWKRYLAKSRVPGFYLRSAARRYGLSYHSEQWPNPDSRITLTGDTDRLGLPRVHIDYRFHDNDVRSILSTHDLLDRWLRQSAIGQLHYRAPAAERSPDILRQAKHGAHQIGTARMADTRRDGVVDGDCRTFDSANLFVASSAILPTSGQANPTLTTIALALRLAARLQRELRPPRVAGRT